MKIIYTMLMMLLVSSVMNKPELVNEPIAHVVLPEITVCVTPYHPIEKVTHIELDSVEEVLKHYNYYFQLVADNSPFDKSFVAGIFNLETNYGKLNNGKSLWARALNPTGQVHSKYNKYEIGTTWSSDDGGSTKARFATLKDSALGWAWLLSLSRYRPCSKMKRLEDQCYCMYKAGYHTSPRWKKRVNFVRQARTIFSKLNLDE